MKQQILFYVLIILLGTGLNYLFRISVGLDVNWHNTFLSAVSAALLVWVWGVIKNRKA